MNEQTSEHRLERERRARREAEQLLETKSRELYLANKELQTLAAMLERRVAKRTEELAHARDDALAASRAKSRFMAVMSHEIRSPLNGVIGALGLLRDTELDEEQRRYVEVSRTSAASLLAIVNDVLDYSKIEANKLGLEPASFRVGALIGEVAESFGDRCREKSIALVHDIDERVPRQVVGDAARVRQVLVNLVDNAVKFTRSGEIRVTVAPGGSSSDGVWIVFSVEDTGVGIAEHDQSHLFKEFWSGSPDTPARITGTGLGLAIASRLVDLMGGEMGVESALGEGSRFWFRLPFATAAQSDAAPAAVAGCDADGTAPQLSGRVLLAEDDTANQVIAEAMLAKSGLGVDTVCDGREALEAMRARSYDAVLMDIDMPEMGGVDAIRAIRALEGGRARTPVVAMTAHAMRGDRERFLAEGFDEHLVKPISRQGLLDCLARWLGSGVSASRAVLPAEVAAQSVLDRETLQHLAHDVGEENLTELIEVFIEELDHRTASIEQAARASDLAALAAEAHPLKSSAASFGAQALSRVARDIETAAKQHDATRACAEAARAQQVAQMTREQLLGEIRARR